MSDPPDANTTLSVTAIIISAVSALAACFTALYNAFAKAKLKAEMHKEYGDMSRKRKEFWKSIEICYQRKVQDWRKYHSMREELYEFAIRIGPPYVEGDVAKWARDELENPESDYFGRNASHKQMWELASYVYYPEKSNVEEMFMGEHNFRNENDSSTSLPDSKELHFTRAELAWFWDKWAPLLKNPLIRKYSYLTERYDSSKPELYLLAWLEVALAYKIGQPGKGKVELFKLAKKFYSKREPLEERTYRPKKQARDIRRDRDAPY